LPKKKILGGGEEEVRGEKGKDFAFTPITAPSPPERDRLGEKAGLPESAAPREHPRRKRGKKLPFLKGSEFLP